MPDDVTDDVWIAIADKAIREAEDVECPLEDFSHGLKVIEQVICDRRVEVEDEVEAEAEE